MRNHRFFLCTFLAAQSFLVGTGFSQDTTAPTIDRVTPQAGGTVVRLSEIEVLFSEEMQGVDAGDLLINGTPATDLSASSAGNYRFTFTQPTTGMVTVTFAPAHGITDAANPSNAFVPPGPWTYELNPALALYDIRINEFLANNQTGIRDEDGTFQDWIELYNPGIIQVPLAGCFLTDDKSNLRKWRFPSNAPPVMSPNTYLLVWASNKDRTNAAKPMHTNFRLNPTAGYLALVDATGTNVISSYDPFYPIQSADISYGRDAADPSISGYFVKPTPDAINSSSGTGFAAPVQFSREGGTFITPFNVALSVASTNAVIRYVLVTNAATASATVTNVPGTNSPIYTGPLPVNLTTQVRVRAFEPGKLPSEPASVTYIQINAEVAGFSSDLPMVIIHNFNGGTLQSVQTDRTAAIASFHADLDRSSPTNKPDLMTRGAANDRGSSTGGQLKVNMAVEFWDEFNQDTDHPFLNMPAESDWVLYGINGFDPGLMHNAIFHWFGNGLGRYSSRTRYVEVFLKVNAGPVTMADYNGLYLAEEKPKRNKNRVDIEALQPENTNAPSVTGGYLLRVDRIDADERTFALPDITITNLFVAGLPVTMTYGNGPGDPVIVDYPNSLQWGTDPRRAAQRFYIADYFTNFLRALTSPSFTNTLTGYPAYVDVDSWVDNHIANTICFNVDGYRLSGYFFKDRNKKMEQGPPWDCDRCLGTGGSGNTPQADNRCYNPRQFRIPVTGYPGSDPDNGTDFFGTANGTGVDWWDRMFRDPDFWQRWIDHYQQFRATRFSNQAVVAMVDEFYKDIKEAQVRDQRKWSATFNYPRWGVQAAQGYTFDFGSPDPQFIAPAKGGYFTNEVNFQKRWLLDRLDFLDTNFLAMPRLALGDSAVTPGTVINVQAAAKPGTLLLYTLNGTDPRLAGGGVSPQALTNVGSLTLTVTSNVWLFARCYNTNHFNLTNKYVSASSYEVGKPHINSHWSGPASASYYTSVPPLRITELMYHPDGAVLNDTNAADNFEYIEVKNIGATPLNVNRFRLSGGVNFDFPNQLLQPSQYAVIVRDVAAFQSRYNSGALILGKYTNNLANDGDHLVLEGGLGEPIHDFNYDDDWYPITDGPGFSLQIINDAAPLKVAGPTNQIDNWGLPTSWRASGVVNGSPGAADPAPTAVAAVYVNEVLTDTDPLPGDAIELYNSTGSPVNVGDWYLTDDFGDPKKFRIPNPTMIPANDYVTFYQSNSFGVGLTGFALSSKGDEVYLFSGDASGNLTGWTHGFDFGAQANGTTFGRLVVSTGEDQFPTQTSPTLGAANAGPKIGPVVISEINYQPPDLVYPFARVPNNVDEYIELHSLPGSSVQLYDTSYPANTWQLRDAVNFTFPPNVVMPPDSYLLVVSFDPADPVARQKFITVNNVPPGTPIYGPWEGALENTGDSVELVRPDVPDPIGTPTAGFVAQLLVDKVNYNSVPPWPVGANGIGASISRLNVAAYGNDPANWKAAVKTPGAPTTGGTPPVITTQPMSLTVVETYSAVFSVTATGTAPIGYQWAFNGEPIYGEVSPLLMLNNITPAQAGNYSVYVFNPAGTIVSSNAALTVLRAATIEIQPVTINVRVRPDPAAAPTTNVTFTVFASSTTPIRYQWRFNVTNDIVGQTNTTLTLTNVQVSNDGLYGVAITDDVGTVFTTNAPLYAFVTPVIIQAPLSQTVPAGSQVDLSVAITGNPPPFGYQWRSNSFVFPLIVSNSRSNFFSFKSATNAVAATVRVVVTNAASVGNAVSATFTITTVADTDFDGLPDTVEIALGLDPNNSADGAGDLDHDGASNRDEYIAGTDPNSNQSYLRVDQVTVPGTATIEVAAVSNRTYSVQYTDALPTTTWRKLADVLARTTNHVELISDPNWTPNRFYRVALPAQPQ